MNKLLSTLILSAGMSLSATAATALLDSSIVGYSDFASQTADFGTRKDSVSITSDDSNLTLSGITFNGYGANTVSYTHLDVYKRQAETEHVTREAFWNYFVPGCHEHYLLHIMRVSPSFIPELDAVAVHGSRIVGKHR